MPAISAKEPAPFKPERLPNGLQPTFMLKVPTLRERIALDAAIAAEGARYPTDLEFAAALRDGVHDQVIEEEQPDLVALIDEFEAKAEAGERAEGDLASGIDQISTTLRPHHRPLAAIVAERARFLSIAMLVRAEMLLVGIDDDDGAPRLDRRGGRLTEACTEALEDRYGRGITVLIGSATIPLTNPTPGETKNSGSPPPSPPDPAISTAVTQPPTDRSGISSETGTSTTQD